jgi:hypothetical protein
MPAHIGMPGGPVSPPIPAPCHDPLRFPLDEGKSRMLLL